MANAPSELSSLLPSAVSGWHAAGQDSSYDRSTLFDYIDGGAELYLSYRFKEVINRRYKREGQPDIVVDNLPHATFNGDDAQLDAAIEYLKEQIRLNPPQVPIVPAYPDKSLKSGQ